MEKTTDSARRSGPSASTAALVEPRGRRAISIALMLAHSLLSGGFPGLSAEKPLPTIFEIDDPVMAAMWESHPHQEIDTLGFEGGGGHVVEVRREPFVFLHREITDYGEKP